MRYILQEVEYDRKQHLLLLGNNISFHRKETVLSSYCHIIGLFLPTKKGGERFVRFCH